MEGKSLDMWGENHILQLGWAPQRPVRSPNSLEVRSGNLTRRSARPCVLALIVQELFELNKSRGDHNALLGSFDNKTSLFLRYISRFGQYLNYLTLVEVPKLQVQDLLSPQRPKEKDNGTFAPNLELLD